MKSLLQQVVKMATLLHSLVESVAATFEPAWASGLAVSLRGWCAICESCLQALHTLAHA